MRKQFTLLMVFLLLAGINFAQKPQRIGGMPPDGYAQGGATFGTQSANTDVLSLWALPSTGGTSGNTRIPGNTYNYQRTQYLIRPAEMAASGFPVGATIDAIGFLVGTAGGTSQTGSFKVYLMNTSDVTYTLGTTWTTAGFTLVSNIASFAVPIAAGPYVVNFSGGTPFTYTGGGVYVAWEFSNRNAVGTGPVVALCNLNLTNGLVGQRSLTALPTTLAYSNWRPATMFVNNSITDVFQVTNIYAMEKTPVPSGVPAGISARVINNGPAPDSFLATLTITSQANAAVRYTATQSVSGLAVGAAAIISFPPWTTTFLENVDVTVSVSPGAGENFLVNNSMSIPVNVNSNLFGYCYSFNPVTGYGAGTGGGIFASRFFMNGTGTVPGANLGMYAYAANVGNTISAVVINSAGAIVAQSADHVITSGDLGTYINFTFPSPPSFTNEEFYVGLVQPASAGGWYPMACMVDSPYRDNAFFFFAIGDPTPYLLDDDYKYLIEAQVAISGPTVPTLSEWFLILLGASLLAIGTIFLLKRR